MWIWEGEEGSQSWKGAAPDGGGKQKDGMGERKWSGQSKKNTTDLGRKWEGEMEEKLGKSLEI
jgi:hypothetical protein